MSNVFRVFFRLPWWAYIVLGFLTLPAALLFYQTSVQAEVTKLQARAGAGPDLVDLTYFNAAENLGLGDEINIVAQINPAYTSEIQFKRFAGSNGNSHMFVLFGGADNEAEKIAQGIVIARDRDEFLAWMRQRVLGTGEYSPIFHINGKVETSHGIGSLISNAFANNGLTRSDDFIVVIPFVDGREAAFAPSDANPMTVPLGLLAAGSLLLFMGLKRRRSVLKKSEAVEALLREHGDAMGVPAE
jgi:hypothetical protein